MASPGNELPNLRVKHCVRGGRAAAGIHPTRAQRPVKPTGEIHMKKRDFFGRIQHGIYGSGRCELRDVR